MPKLYPLSKPNGVFFVYVSALLWYVLHLTNTQVNKLFSENAFDAVMHFAAVAYVGESTMEPLR